MPFHEFLQDEDGATNDTLSWTVVGAVVVALALAVGLSTGGGAVATGGTVNDTLNDKDLPRKIWPAYQG